MNLPLISKAYGLVYSRSESDCSGSGAQHPLQRRRCRVQLGDVRHFRDLSYLARHSIHSLLSAVCGTAMYPFAQNHTYLSARNPAFVRIRRADRCVRLAHSCAAVRAAHAAALLYADHVCHRGRRISVREEQNGAHADRRYCEHHFRGIHLRFSAVKNSFDLSMVAISALLCIINHSPFYGIGVGTVLSALMLGRIIKLYEVLWRVKA